jgi:hypothetical protein
MEDIGFFSGKKQIGDPAEVISHGGKVIWKCTIEGAWYELTRNTFRCGSSYRFNVKRKLG